MTNQNAINEAINEAISAESAHDLADALRDAGVTATRNGNDTKCIIPGYGTVFFHDLEQNPGWVVRNHYRDGCDYPTSASELAADLAEIVEMKKQIM